MASELEEEDFKGQQINLALWRKLAKFVFPFKRKVAGLVLLAVTLSVCDVALPFITGKVIDAIRTPDGALARWAIAYVATCALLSVCVFLFILAAGAISIGVCADVRTAAFDKLQELPFSYFDRRAVGWLMARLTSDCSSLSRVAAWGTLDIVWGVTTISLMAGVMFWLNWRLALIVCLVAPLLFFTTWFFKRRLLKANRRIKKTNSQLTAAFNEALQGVRTTKSLVREHQNAREFADQTAAMYRHSMQSAIYSAVFMPMVTSICALGIALALWAGGLDVINQTISLGLLVTFLQYAANLQGPAQELANTLTMVQSAQASAERIQGLLDEPLVIEDSPQVKSRIAAAINLRSGDVAIDGYPERIETIEFRNVSFEYKEGQPVLHNFSLIVQAGETIALVGATGGGKSTIVSLVCRFYEPTSGQILINGVDYRERSLRWLHGNLGMVLQQPHLFSGPIRENIRYGKLDATDAEVEAAARLTNAHSFIEKFQDGYLAGVGEGGNQLSTGQKQLIALARAVLADPQIFVMDEATSSVDTQTERDIQTAVETVLEGRISFVIAHRLSTIRNADQIIVIDGGRIVEQGDHRSLIAARGRYFELYSNQFIHDREEALLRAEA
ncbi:MAG TPA: ABC transporter ATP-binding protein [Tepidisphaeraceae bacterium]|nr:ABC transporter ATP-binding protein [Tepidisphaeraceae bacterium]